MADRTLTHSDILSVDDRAEITREYIERLYHRIFDDFFSRTAREFATAVEFSAEIGEIEIAATRQQQDFPIRRLSKDFESAVNEVAEIADGFGSDCWIEFSFPVELTFKLGSEFINRKALAEKSGEGR